MTEEKSNSVSKFQRLLDGAKRLIPSKGVVMTFLATALRLLVSLLVGAGIFWRKVLKGIILVFWIIGLVYLAG